MRTLAAWLLTSAIAFSAATDDFIAAAKTKHGEPGEKAARFLVEHMHADDKDQLSVEFLTENLNLAFQARATFPWAAKVPEDIFLNDVLPYAVLDEPRDPWRADFLEKATPMVKDAKTATEAVQILNRDFFKLINTHYHKKRKRPNQSPRESIEQGKATCTGLSIILVDVCRAIGIPARAVGTPLWTNERGNHTWIEIWDQGWHFTGADEFDPKGLNHGWFTGDAAKADSNNPLHPIYASSWKRRDLHFPLVWAPQNTQVAAVDVTTRYAKKETATKHTLGIRYFEGDERRPVRGSLHDSEGKLIKTFTTKAGTSDLNDMPRLEVVPGQTYTLRFIGDFEVLESEPFTAEAGESTFDAKKSQLKQISAKDAIPVTRETAPDIIDLTFIRLVAEQKKAREKELEERAITIGDKTLKWLEKTFGDEPDDGRSLWISMHGGGGAPPRVNDGQWRNQIGLYQPAEGIYVAPRAPTDTWNLWHEAHIDPLFSRLIEDMIAYRNVNPNKVYLMGYSAGGDGVWQLAPRMADRFAAAAMMAGHPNEASLLGLRNLPFAIFMGGADSAYNRNKIAAKKTAELDALQKADPDGYIHMSRIYEGLPHWMNHKDAEALPWMAKFTRNPWPKTIVWRQDDVTHDRFYWLQLPEGSAKKDDEFRAQIDGQSIHLTGPFRSGTQLLLNDELLDLDQPIQVHLNGKSIATFTAKRSIDVIKASLKDRLDPASCPTAIFTLP